MLTIIWSETQIGLYYININYTVKHTDNGIESPCTNTACNHSTQLTRSPRLQTNTHQWDQLYYTLFFPKLLDFRLLNTRSVVNSKKIILDSILLTAFKTFLHILYFSNNSVAKLTTPFRMPRNVVEFHMIVLLKFNQPVQGQHPPIMQKASAFLQILKTLSF